ncbi:hypothetical protein INR49_013521 [Caranx melampygus]|nr:hypothetical protein INR49_013521 [Caranx melampygus]
MIPVQGPRGGNKAVGVRHITSSLAAAHTGLQAVLVAGSALEGFEGICETVAKHRHLAAMARWAWDEGKAPTVPFLLSMLTLLVVNIQSLVAPAYMSRSSGSVSLSSSSEPRYPYRCPCASPLVEGVLARSASELLVQSESRESEGPSSLNISFSTRPLFPEATRNLTLFCGFSWSAVSIVPSIANPVLHYMVHSIAA